MTEELKNIRTVLDEELLRQRGTQASTQPMKDSSFLRKKEISSGDRSWNSTKNSPISPRQIHPWKNNLKNLRQKLKIIKAWWWVFRGRSWRFNKRPLKMKSSDIALLFQCFHLLCRQSTQNKQFPPSRASQPWLVTSRGILLWAAGQPSTQCSWSVIKVSRCWTARSKGRSRS